MPNPYEIPRGTWDGYIADGPSSATGGATLSVVREPGATQVVRLLWDTFDLHPDAQIIGATLEINILGIDDADSLCLTAGWDRRRPIGISQYPSNGAATNALDGVRLSVLNTGIQLIPLDNAQGVNHCATGLTLCIEDPGAAPPGVNAIALSSFEGGAPAKLHLQFSAGSNPDDGTPPPPGGGGGGGGGGSGPPPGGGNDPGSEDHGKDRPPDDPGGDQNRPNVYRPARENATIAEGLLSGKRGPMIQYSTKLRAVGVRIVEQ